jgi:methionine aminopeptidase
VPGNARSRAVMSKRGMRQTASDDFDHPLVPAGHPLKAGPVSLVQGSIVTPMLNAGKRETRQLPDGWTVVTKDGSLSAQWEHMVAVTPEGYEVLTA